MSKDTDELGIKIANILSQITEDTKNELAAREILEESETQFSSFKDLIHSMAFQAQKQKLDLIPADEPYNLLRGWADINSEKYWQIHISDLSKSLKHIDGSDLMLKAMNTALLAKALEAICNAY